VPRKDRPVPMARRLGHHAEACSRERIEPGPPVVPTAQRAMDDCRVSGTQRFEVAADQAIARVSAICHTQVTSALLTNLDGSDKVQRQSQ